MKKLSIVLTAALLVAQIGLLPAFAGGNDLYTEDFNRTSQAVLQDGGDFTYVERPVDGVAVDTTPVADGTGKDRVLLSGKKDNRKVSFKMADVEGAVNGAISGIIVFEGDFRMEGRPAYIDDATKKAPSGTVKFFDFLSGTTSVFTLGMGTFTDTGFNLRPLYANSETGSNVTAGSVTVDGKPLEYQKWYHFKTELDTENGKVTAMVENFTIVDNQNFYGNVNSKPLSQIQATHANGAQVDKTTPDNAHLQPFLLDNIRVYRNKTDVGGVTSDVYTVSEYVISNIPDGTEVAAFLSNITLPEGAAEAKVYLADGTTERTNGAVETGDWLKVEPDGPDYRLQLESCLYFECLDGPLQSTATVAAGWKLIERPADGAAVDYDTVTEAAENAGKDRVLLSKALSGGKVTMDTGTLTGKFTLQYQFRVEEQSSTLAAGGLRLISLMGTASGTTKDAVGLSTGSSSAEGFHLRPIYGPKGTALNDKGPTLAYQTWHTAEICVDIENNSAAIRINGQNIFDTDTVSLWNDTFQDITQLQFYGKSTAAVNFMIDSVQIVLPPVIAQAQSSVYTVNQEEKNVKNVPFGTEVTTFLTNITYTEEGSGSLTDSGGNAKTSGAVVTGDKLVVTPGGTVYTITVDARPEVPSQAQSGVYDINQTELMIRGVAPETEVAAFLGNLTYTEGGSGTLRSSDGQEKTTGTILYTDTLTVEPGGKVYHILTTDILTYLDFNDQKIPPAGWKMNADTYHAMQRPLGGETDPGLTTVPNPNDYALYSGGSNNSAANQATFALRQAEDVEITMDFLVKQRVDDANANQIKLVELVVERKNEAEPSAQSLAVCNVATTTGFVITHYPGNGTTVGRQNQAFGTGDWGTWHTLKVLASTKRNNAAVWLDGTLVGTAEFQGAKKDSNILTAIRLYNGKRADYTAAAPSPYYIDNIKIKTVSGECTASSEIYRVQEHAISGILKGTTVDTFQNNIRIPAGANAVIYSVYDAKIPQNNVPRTEGALAEGDTLVVTAADGFSKAVYILHTAAPAEVYFTDTAGQEIAAVGQLDGGKMKVAAEIYNNGAFGNHTTFVLVVTAYKGNEMVKANYKRVTVPLGQTKTVIEMEPITVEDGLTYSACVWDELIPMIPLSLPKDIGE